MDKRTRRFFPAGRQALPRNTRSRAPVCRTRPDPADRSTKKMNKGVTAHSVKVSLFRRHHRSSPNPTHNLAVPPLALVFSPFSSPRLGPERKHEDRPSRTFQLRKVLGGACACARAHFESLASISLPVWRVRQMPIAITHSSVMSLCLGPPWGRMGGFLYRYRDILA